MKNDSARRASFHDNREYVMQKCWITARSQTSRCWPRLTLECVPMRGHEPWTRTATNRRQISANGWTGTRKSEICPQKLSVQLSRNKWYSRFLRVMLYLSTRCK